jgi:hypothetical protein
MEKCPVAQVERGGSQPLRKPQFGCAGHLFADLTKSGASFDDFKEKFLLLSFSISYLDSVSILSARNAGEVVIATVKILI